MKITSLFTTRILLSCLLLLFSSGVYAQDDSWTSRAAYPGPGREAGIAFSIGAKAYVGFGWIISAYHNDFWEWDQVTNTWTQKTSPFITADVSREGMVSFAIGTKGYAGMGQSFGPVYHRDLYEYDPATNIWTAKASLASGNERSYAVSFVMGGLGYVGTGENGATYRKDFWKYNPGTNTWATAVDLPSGASVRGYAMTFTIGSKAFIAGGSDNISLFNDLWEFNGTTWTQRTSMPVARHSGIGFAVCNRGYVGTGVVGHSTISSDVWEYNGDANATGYNTWIRRRDMPAENHLASTFIMNNDAYVAIGHSIGFLQTLWKYNPIVTITHTPLSAVQVTDAPVVLSGGYPAGGAYSGTGVTANVFYPATAGAGLHTITYTYGCGTVQRTIRVNPCTSQSGNTWTAKLNYPGATFNGESGFSIGTKGYIITGDNSNTPSNAFWEWNSATNTWAQLSNFAGVPRKEASTFTIGTKAYIGVGYTMDANIVCKDFWEWDQATNAWTRQADFPGEARAMAVGFSIGNKGYIGTGTGATGNVFKDLYEWNQSNNTWARKSDFPGGDRFMAVGFAIGNKGYIGTGSTSSATIWNGNKDLWEWEPIADVWTRKSDYIGIAVSHTFSFTIGSSAFVGGGTISNGSGGGVGVFTFYEWNQLSNGWIQRATLSSASSNTAAFAINGKGYYKSSGVNFHEYGPLTCAPSVVTNSLAGINFCAGNVVSIPYTALGTFNSGNIFTAQLSNSSGSFASPVTLETVTSTTSGNIAALIPAGTAYGTGYRIRVNASNPSTIGTDNGANFTIFPSGGVTLTSFNAVYESTAPFALTGGSPAGGTYSGTGVTSNTFDPAVAGAGTHTITYSNGCYSVQKTITVIGCADGAWTAKANFTGTTVNSESGFTIGTKNYLIGGQGGGGRTKYFWSWDQTTNTWTQLTDFPGRGRELAVAFSIGTKGYFGTGYGQAAPAVDPLNDFWEWDQPTNTWLQKANFPGVARYSAVGFAIGTKGYIGTGFGYVSSVGTLFNDFYEWDQATNTWSRKADLPANTRRAAFSFALGTKAYVGGGISGISLDINNTDFWEWNQTSNTWTKKNDLPGEPKRNMFGMVVSSKAYIGGGIYNSNSMATFEFWQWNALTDTWIMKTPIPSTLALDIRMPTYGLNGKGYVKASFADYYEYFPDCQPLGIAVNDISSSIFCLGGPATSVPYTALGTFAGSNVFTAQLSDPNGNFGSPIAVGSLSSNVSGSINVTLPANLPAGSNYRIRVVSTPTTLVTGMSSTSALTINPTVTFTAPNAVYSTDSPFALTQGSPSGGTYSGNGVSNNMFDPLTAGIGLHQITYTYGCTSIQRSIQVIGCTDGSWSQKANCPSVPVVGDVAFSIGTKGYWVTGSNSKLFWQWDQVTDTWTQLADFAGVQRYSAAGFSIGTKGYIGLGTSSSTPYNMNDFWEWNQTTNTWVQKSNFPGTTRNNAATFVIGTKGYLTTGVSSGSTYFKDLWEWDQVTDIWTRKADMPTSTGRRFVAAFALGNKGYVGGGGYISSYYNDFWEWNQSTNTWTAKNNLPGTGANRFGLTIGSKAYVGGGQDITTGAFLHSFWQWNAVTDSWISKAPTVGNIDAITATFAIGSKGYARINSSLFEYFPDCQPLSVTVNDLSNITFCANTSSISVPYTGLGTFSSENIFTAQLSNAIGSFASPVNIGTVGASTSGLISITIPAGTPAGTGYRIRINASSPALTGLDNGVNIVIPAAVATSITTTYPAMRIDDPYIVLTGGTPSGGVYSGNGVSNGTFDPALAGPGIHEITYSYACSEPAKTYITVINCTENVWTRKQNYPETSSLEETGFSIGNKGYLLYGEMTGGSVKTFWGWDQSTNVWTQYSTFGGTARNNAVGFAIGTKGYIGTGQTTSGTYLTDFWEWNSLTNSWSSKTNFPGGARAYAVGFAIGNKGYIGTGYTSSGSKKDLWEWNQASNAWVQKSDIPGETRFMSYAFTIGTKGYVGCGVGAAGYSSPLREHWEWNQSNDQWTRKSDIPAGSSIALAYSAGFSLGSQGIVVGRNFAGAGDGGVDANYYLWDQATDTWTIKVRLTPDGYHSYFNVHSFVSGLAMNGKGYSKEIGSFWEYGCPPVISANDLAQKNICTGTSVPFSFTLLGSPMNTGNMFYIEFSDPDGVFRSSPYITSSGYSLTTLSSPLNYTIPSYLGQTDNAVYRVRLRSTNPVLISEPSPYLISVKFTHPGVALASFTGVTTGTAPFSLTGGTPEGGVYSGPGVSDGIFDPAAAGVGTHTITYTYNSCSTPATKTIVVSAGGGGDFARPSYGEVTAVQCYPNPFDNRLKVLVNEADNGSTPATFRLLNMQGEVVHKEELTTNQEKEFYMELPTGMYMVQIIIGDQVVGRYKLMKSN
ncbi:MAG: Kelch repeat type 1-containing protein [Cytophagaceae bacterium]|jgi:N-acetylneuraminic acid mutarotase|nr:Kelch repeat type 1-containing protein [Cytophagaceae bacterium]